MIFNFVYEKENSFYQKHSRFAKEMLQSLSSFVSFINPRERKTSLYDSF